MPQWTPTQHNNKKQQQQNNKRKQSEDKIRIVSHERRNRIMPLKKTEGKNRQKD
jgi:hypothetical protein